MSNKRVDALARISGIKSKLSEVADEVAGDGDERIRLSLGVTAKKLEYILEVVCDSIDGELAGKTDDEVARSLVVSFGMVNALTGMLGL